ncbi:MAG TPA: hypothetical protein VJJ72_00055 [Candidatus Paceibacterota bacterium]
MFTADIFLPVDLLDILVALAILFLIFVPLTVNLEKKDGFLLVGPPLFFVSLGFLLFLIFAAIANWSTPIR